MTARLIITDGTTEVNLLNRISGYVLSSWRPTIAGYKRGGVHQQSPISDGRRLVSKYFDNAIETFILKALDASQDELIEETQRLRRLLEKASDYWTTDWQDDPVWIEARASKETNTRYAVIQQGRIAEDENPFSQPFLQADCNAVMDNLTLVVERMHWLANEPGSGACVPVSGSATFNSVDYGIVNTDCSEEAYLANKYNEANIMFVYNRHSVTGWLGNFVGVATPFAFTPVLANPDVGEVYFGIDSTHIDGGPFCSLVFDISTPIVYGAGDTGEWQYWNGFNWNTALVVQDNTSDGGTTIDKPFNTPGVGSVHWEQPDDWSPTPGVPAGIPVANVYWVRVEFTVGTGFGAAWQDNREIYTVTWPGVDIAAGDVLGDIPALAFHQIRNRSGSWPAEGTLLDALTDKLIVSTRSIDRGSNFCAYLPASDEQMPPSVTASITAPLAFVDPLTDAPTGVAAQGIPVGLATGVEWDIAAAVADQYLGLYRAFVRCHYDITGGGAADGASLRLQWRYLDFGQYIVGDEISIPTDDPWLLIDMGIVNFAPGILPSSIVLAKIVIELQAAGDGGLLTVYDLILVPIDEFAIELLTTDAPGFFSAGYHERFDIDSVSEFKEMISTRLTLTDLFPPNDVFLSRYQAITSSPCVLQANKSQRLWAVALNYNIVDNVYQAFPWITHSVSILKNDRYLSMRGSR